MLPYSIRTHLDDPETVDDSSPRIYSTEEPRYLSPAVCTLILENVLRLHLYLRYPQGKVQIATQDFIAV